MANRVLGVNLHGTIETSVKSWRITRTLPHRMEGRKGIFTRKIAGAKPQRDKSEQDFREKEIIPA